MLFFLSCAACSVNLGTRVLISSCVFNTDSSCPHIYFLISPGCHQHAIATKLFDQKTWLCLSQSLHMRFFPSPQSASSNHSPWRVNLGKTRPGVFTCFRKTRISSVRILTFSSCSSLYDTFSMFAIFLVLFPLFRCSLPKAMSISRSEILRRKKAETEVEKLPLVKVLESVS